MKKKPQKTSQIERIKSEALKIAEQLLNKYIKKNQKDNYNCLLHLLVFFKGLQEFTTLSKLTQNRTWHKDNKLVETIWITKCDCKARLEFASTLCQEPINEQCNHIALVKVPKAPR